MYAGAGYDVIYIQRYPYANCFGDYIAHTGIDLRTFELLTFSMLVTPGSAEAQVKGYVAGSLNVGNGRAALLAVLTQLLPFIGYPPPQGHIPSARSVWRGSCRCRVHRAGPQSLPARRTAAVRRLDDPSHVSRARPTHRRSDRRSPPPGTAPTMHRKGGIGRVLLGWRLRATPRPEWRIRCRSSQLRQLATERRPPHPQLPDRGQLRLTRQSSRRQRPTTHRETESRQRTPRRQGIPQRRSRFL